MRQRSREAGDIVNLVRSRRARRVARTVVLALMLGLTALTLPDSTPQPEQVIAVRMKHAEGVDPTPGVVWILGIGSDARPGQDMNRSRGDAIQLVGLNTRTGAATAIGVPRDSWVPIPGHGREKINSALYFGGPRLMGRTVGNLVGVQPDYVVVTRFKYFEQMINDIGGIHVRNPRRFTDPYLRPKGFPQGKIKVDGYGALGFARIRKNLAGGDFDRSANQQRVLRGIQGTVAAKAERPGFIEKSVLSVLRHTSTNMRPAEVFRLAQVVAQVDRSRITHCVLSGRIGSVGAQSVVFPNVPQAKRLGRDARRDAVISRC